MLTFHRTFVGTSRRCSEQAAGKVIRLDSQTAEQWGCGRRTRRGDQEIFRFNLAVPELLRNFRGAIEDDLSNFLVECGWIGHIGSGTQTGLPNGSRLSCGPTLRRHSYTSEYHDS